MENAPPATRIVPLVSAGIGQDSGSGSTQPSLNTIFSCASLVLLTSRGVPSNSCSDGLTGDRDRFRNAVLFLDIIDRCGGGGVAASRYRTDNAFILVPHGRAVNGSRTAWVTVSRPCHKKTVQNRFVRTSLNVDQL